MADQVLTSGSSDRRGQVKSRTPGTAARANPRLVIDELRFAWPGTKQAILDIAHLALDKAENVFLHGRSGSGKTTLLAAIAGLVEIPPDTIQVCNTDIGRLHGSDRDRFRADHIGIIFQQLNLVPYLSALDNVLLPCRFSRRRRAALGGPAMARQEALRLLSALGLSSAELQSAQAGKLSVGQQQRVAAARALIGGPDLILADEPTSALDAETKEDLLRLLLDECKKTSATLLFVSHDKSLKSMFDRTLDFARLNQARRGQEC